MLLIGIGGSGRQSLSRLSAYIIGFKVFQIEVTKHYRKNEFREGMSERILYAGFRSSRFEVLVTAASVIVCSHKFNERRHCFFFFIANLKHSTKSNYYFTRHYPKGPYVPAWHHDHLSLLPPLTYFCLDFWPVYLPVSRLLQFRVCLFFVSLCFSGKRLQWSQIQLQLRRILRNYQLVMNLYLRFQTVILWKIDFLRMYFLYKFVPLRPMSTKIKNIFDALVVTLGFRLT